MDNELKTLNKTANSLGFDLAFFPGIPIAAVPIYFIFSNYKELIFTFLEVKFEEGYQQHIILLILALVFSILTYKISSWTDPLYDKFYIEKRNKNSDLNQFIKKAREKWDSMKFVDDIEKTDINRWTLEKLQKDDKSEYKRIKQILSLSKLLRILVIPSFILGIVKTLDNNLKFGIICLVVAIVFLFISWSFRADYSKALYRWFISAK